MVRVLHLFGRVPESATSHTAALLEQHAPPDVRITSHHIGSRGIDHHWLGAACDLMRPSFDLVHAWDGRALSVALLNRRMPVLYSPGAFSKSQLKRLRTVLHLRDVRIICATAAQQDLLRDCGIGPDHVRVIEPALAPELTSSCRNSELREKLNFRSDDIVVLAPGESSRLAQHRRALWAVSILHVLDPRYRLLVWGRGDQVESLRSLAHKLRQPKVLTCAEPFLNRKVVFQELCGVADMVLATDRRTASPLPLAHCMACGMPIVAASDGLAEPFLKNHQTAAMVPRATPRLLAQQILELSRDPTLGAKLGGQARQAAMDRFSIPQFVDAHVQAYRELASGSGLTIGQPRAVKN